MNLHLTLHVFKKLNLQPFLLKGKTEFKWISAMSTLEM